MISYFARRLLGGVATMLGMTFILYSIFFEIHYDFNNFGECTLPLYPYKPSTSTISFLEREAIQYHIDESFLVGYLKWLFDPTSTNANAFPDEAPRQRPFIHISIAGYTLSGSGLLTGDFGQSLQVQKGATPIDASKLDLLGFFASLFLPGMALVCLQRIGHKPYSHIPYGHHLNMSACLSPNTNTRSF